MMKYDYLIGGAGFSGVVIAEQLARIRDRRVLLIDRRPHIGGNAYDYHDDAGVLVHKYGPHIFHTKMRHVVEYLSQFTHWRFYEHRVKANLNGKLYPMPINRTTINKYYGLDLDEEGVRKFYECVKVPMERINNSEDAVISQVGRELYETFFKHYTHKQWEMWPSELKPEVCRRIPVRTNDDDRYFADEYQFMPLEGYTRMFERMLDHPNIEIRTGISYEDVKEGVRFNRLIYTGPIDEFFGYMHGNLPYRSLRIELEHVDHEWYQPVATINYPTPEPTFTRITEYKHMTGQRHPATTIAREYPTAVGEPYYIVPEDGALGRYEKYRKEAEKLKSVSFVGRLAEYRYYNMDQVVDRGLKVAEELEG